MTRKLAGIGGASQAERPASKLAQNKVAAMVFARIDAFLRRVRT
jgi:hypothetical protein